MLQIRSAANGFAGKRRLSSRFVHILMSFVFVLSIIEAASSVAGRKGISIFKVPISLSSLKHTATS